MRSISQLFDKLWFIKWQKPLLWFANTSYGRDVLGLNGNRSSIGREKILAILPNAILWKSKDVDRGVYSFEFRTHEKFAKRLFYEYKYIWKAIHNWDTLFANNFNPKWNLGFDSFGPLYPAAGNVSGYDADTRRQGVNETFATIRGGAGTSADATSVDMVSYLAASTTSNQFQRMLRDVILFDTSSLGGGTIDTATLSIASSNNIDAACKLNTIGSIGGVIVSSNPASTSSTAAADYAVANFGTTSYASVTYANWSGTNNTYNDFTLNASGEANINTSGISKFGFISNWDFNNSFGGSWVSGEVSLLGGWMADNTGTAADPKLAGTYTPATAIKDIIGSGLGIPFPR